MSVIVQCWHYLSLPPWGLRTSLTVNKNCMAHTKRQQRFNDNVNAHNANVTSYTTTYSSAVITVNCSARNSSLISLAVTGDIFSKKINDSSASNRLTRQSKPKLTSVSLTPTFFDLVDTSKLLHKKSAPSRDVPRDEFVDCALLARPGDAEAPVERLRGDQATVYRAMFRRIQVGRVQRVLGYPGAVCDRRSVPMGLRPGLQHHGGVAAALAPAYGAVCVQHVLQHGCGTSRGLPRGPQGPGRKSRPGPAVHWRSGTGWRPG